MAVITKVESQVKNKSRVNIYLDHVFFTGCSLEVAVSFGLVKGKEISQEALDNIVFENEKSEALNKSLVLIGKNLKTRKQLQIYLKDKGYSEKIAEFVIDKLCEYNYINDENYATLYVRSVKNKYGKIKIVNNLRQRGVSDNDIDKALENFETDDEVILNLTQKYLRNKEVNSKTLNNLYRFLQSKGFVYDQIKNIVNKYKEL